MSFDVAKVTKDMVLWVRDWFAANGPDCNAVVGISGGKDSSVAAAVCVEALGKDRVIGVLMPNGVQHDIDVAKALVEHLGIRSYEVNIQPTYEAIYEGVKQAVGTVSEQTRQNIAPRIRMTVLYAVSQSNNGRVTNTCNLSEDWVGYSTRYDDSVGDFSPLSQLTVQEVKAVDAIWVCPRNLWTRYPSTACAARRMRTI